MRILFASTRGSGHMQPLLPYAKTLQQRGHDVVLAAPDEVAEAVGAAGLRHLTVGHPGDAALAPIWARMRDVGGVEALKIAMRELFAGASAKAALPLMQEHIQSFGPDLIVRESAEFSSFVSAERAGVPHASVAVHLPSFEASFFPLTIDAVNGLRGEVGLPPDDGDAMKTTPLFTAFPASLDDPAVAPFGASPFRARMPEPQALPSSGHAWSPPDDDTPLVYITFGTIVGGSPQSHAVYRAAIDAVRDLPVHALLTTGRGMEQGALGAVPDNVVVEAWVPQSDVLAHARALVCHGGSGTVTGALAAGVPMVVAPMFADQPYNASRVVAVGAGITVDRPDPATLRAAIERVISAADLQAGAGRVADEIASLPSIDDAVDALLALAA